MNDEHYWRSALEDARDVLVKFLEDPDQLARCGRFSALVGDALAAGHTVFTCGNGGSHCDAMHFAEELTGRYRQNRRPLPALALGDPSHTTCVSNDYGFEHVFARQVEAFGRDGDVLIGLSTSGNSQNVCRAFEVAEKKGVRRVGLLGKDGGKLLEMSDLAIVVPGQTSDRIQEIHIKLIHTVIETVERRLFPENYAS